MESHANDKQLVVFRIGREQYALPTTSAREVINYDQPRRLPGADAWVLGVINVRGEIIPICDLSAALGLAVTPAATKIIICDVESGSVGLMVDEVTSVMTISEDEITHPKTLNHPALAGVVNLETGLVVLLDLDEAIGGARSSASSLTSIGANTEIESAGGHVVSLRNGDVSPQEGKAA